MPHPDGTLTMADRAAIDDEIFDEMAARGERPYISLGTSRWDRMSPGLRDAYRTLGKPEGQQPFGDADR